MATPMENVRNGTFINTPQHDFNANQAISGPLSSQPHWTLKRFLRGQPKALGVVQIMIGFTHVIIWTSVNEKRLFLWMTCTTWLFFIISGSCSIAAENKLTRQRVKCSLGWNIVSCCIALYEIITAIMEHVLISSDTPYSSGIVMTNTEIVVRIFLVLFILLEFCIALSTSVFGCKSLCFDPSQDPVASPMGEIPAPVSDPPYEVLTSRPQDYATLQLP